MFQTMIRCLTQVLVLSLACGACAPAGPGPSVPPAVPADDDARAALQRADELLAAAELTGSWLLRDEGLDRARAAGLDEAVVVGLLERILAECLASDGECRAPGDPPDDERERTIGTLMALLGAVGGDASVPLLLRLDVRGYYQGEQGIQRILERRWQAERTAASCVPPTADEVAAQRLALDDFLVVRFREGQLVAEPPAEAERDNLAYFLAAVAEEGPEVGASQEEEGGSWTRPGPPNQELQRLREALDAAKRDGDLAGVLAAGTGYLEALGYPGPLRTADEDRYAWGGAGWSYIMRDTALAAEALGDLELAADLDRRAAPGGGACGTSVDYRWQLQVQAVIRAEERRGRCRAAVAERLLAVDGVPYSDDQEGGPLYGPAALAAAGYDLARLYRGALLTIDRDVDEAELEQVLASAAEPLAGPARARAEAKGPEAWEWRVRALEGLADVAQRDAIPVLRELARNARLPTRLRAIAALAALAERPLNNPCLPLVSFGGSGTGEWSRAIRMLGRSCPAALSAAESAELAAALEPMLVEEDPELRAAVAAALGAIGSSSSLPALRPLVDDPYVIEGGQVCETTEDGVEECRPMRPVADAAREAVVRIEELEREWALQAEMAAETGDVAP
jgi:HEAT repeat protein